MSIIHDALKRVQQGLTPKTNETQANPSTTTQPSSNLYETPAEIEVLPPAAQGTAGEKPSIQNRIKSTFALACAIAITIGSGWYIYQQFQNDIPQVTRLAQKTFYTFIHKKRIRDLLPKTTQEFKPLAQITINPSTATPSNTVSPTSPMTLNIHGIMADATGNLALINDQVYQEGDEVDGAKIVKINLDSITVDINGTEKTIFVKN